MTATAAAPPLDINEVAHGLPFKFEVVSTDRFFVDPTYQRNLTTFVDRIATSFNPALIGAIISSHRKVRAKANLAIIDGQTRWEGAKRAGQPQLLAVIFENLTVSDEARLFAAIQTERRNLSSWERFNAQVIGGAGIAQPIQGVVEGVGLETGNSGTSDRSIAAVAALESVFAWGMGVGIRSAREGKGDHDEGRAFLLRVLRIITEAWPKRDEGYLSADVIRGLGYFLNNYENIDDVRLVRRLSMVTPAVLKHRATSFKAGHAAGGSGASYMAEAIMAQYTKGK